jgi:hypothetical protein
VPTKGYLKHQKNEFSVTKNSISVPGVIVLKRMITSQLFQGHGKTIVIEKYRESIYLLLL